MKKCIVDGCDSIARSKHIEFCGKHYQRMWANGTLETKRREKGTGNINHLGYVRLTKNGVFKFEHVWIAEKALGKELPDSAEVHHVNGDPANNDPKNLVICPDHAYHFFIERRGKAYDSCGHADWLKCRYCKQYDDPKNMYVRKNGLSGYHRKCSNEYIRELNTRKKYNGK